LDIIYIKAAQRGLKQATALAQFFSRIVNGEVPQQFKTFIKQTYLAALENKEKDPDDKTKLWSLGVPSAIRHNISAILP
jgi:hypothetical protein